MQDERGLFTALIGDGRPLLALTALSLLFAGGFALFVTVTEQFLPHDVQYLRMSAAELCAHADCRINAFMFHDRAAFGGSLIAVGALYLWLIEFPLRAGEPWAWWTLALTGAIGFLSFLAYLGYGYLDSWHGVGTLALIPLYVAGLVRTRARVRGARAATRQERAEVAGVGGVRLGRGLLLATALGMVLGGATILTIGMTTVFVPEDLGFMGVSARWLDELNPRLVPLIAHDRAGFGGGLFTTGLIVAACVWFAPLTRALREALWVAGIAGFGCAIGVHFAVGYTDWKHLAPAVAGAGMFALGMMLTRATSRQPSLTPRPPALPSAPPAGPAAAAPRTRAGTRPS